MKSTLAIYGIQDINDNGYPEYVHDHSLVYMENGNIVKMLELERATRKKHDNSMHKNLFELLKSEKLVSSDNYDVVFVDNILGRSFISANGKIRFEAPLNYDLKTDIEKGKCWWLDKEIDGYALNHELAHVYSCIPFFGTFKENSLLVHFDGGASLSNFSAWIWKNNKIELIEYNWNLKQISSFYNANALNFFILNVNRNEHNSLPGKYMGFSSFGVYDRKIENWLSENNFFENIWKNKITFFESVDKNFGIKIQNFSTNDTFLQNIAATIQQIFTRIVIEKLKNLQISTKTEFLYYTGGSALNIITNSEIISNQIFKNVFIPPCTSDTGLALGAASYLEMKKGNEIKIHNPYLNNWNLEANNIDYSYETIKKVAQLLSEKKVIGVCNGNSEIGPRALGNRSIISLANCKQLAKKISQELKKREWYRPLAPIMLEKNTKYFTGLEKIHHLSKFMLLEFDILKNKFSEIEGVVHVDGTSRIQTIFNRNDNEFIFDLLTVLDLNYNIKALINTSFNRKGEPIVHTMENAVDAAKEMNLDALIYNGKFIEIN